MLWTIKITLPQTLQKPVFKGPPVPELGSLVFQLQEPYGCSQLSILLWQELSFGKSVSHHYLWGNTKLTSLVQVPIWGTRITFWLLSNPG